LGLPVRSLCLRMGSDRPSSSIWVGLFGSSMAVSPVFFRKLVQFFSPFLPPLLRVFFLLFFPTVPSFLFHFKTFFFTFLCVLFSRRVVNSTPLIKLPRVLRFFSSELPLAPTHLVRFPLTYHFLPATGDRELRCVFFFFFFFFFPAYAGAFFTGGRCLVGLLHSATSRFS